jgi:hypothetical protein
MNSPACEPYESATSPVAYYQASLQQLTQARHFLQQRLNQHFPSLSESAWATALDLLAPDLWVEREQITLAYQDLVYVTQYLARSPELPILDPPIYSEQTVLLAQQHMHLAELAVWTLPELEAEPSNCGPRLYALVSRLARGNGVAEQVVQALRWGLTVGRPLPLGLPGGNGTPGSPAVEQRLVQLGKHIHSLLPDR